MRRRLSVRINKNNGLAVVEFTMISTALLIIFFGIFEVGRYVYSIQMLNEATRRAARLASVCYMDNNTDIAGMTTITNIIPSGFSSSALTIEYLDASGTPVANPTSSVESIRFVRAKMDTSKTSYTFVNVLTALSGSSVVPKFETTLPAESLGVLRYTSGKHTNCN
jgi:Flp pilus assembly protein TadG